METRLADWIVDTADGKDAESILRACVHCGFCTATCPTYQLLGDELDGPRGRIYLIKQLLEGQEATEKTRLHLDRCLTCRSCETTCPSGVRYHRLLDIGRQVLAVRLPRPLLSRWMRRLLAEAMTRPRLFARGVALGRALRPLLPSFLGDKIPPGAPRHAPRRAARLPPPTRRVLLLAGCVQPGMAPSINLAAQHVLGVLGIEAIEVPRAGCCGALRFHLDAQAAALDDMRALIDLWWPLIDPSTALAGASVEAIVITASGCGAHLKDYGQLLRHDAAYADKAARVSALCREVGDYLVSTNGGALVDQLLPKLLPVAQPAPRVAVHTPCTLQHALRRRGDVERLLGAAGYVLSPVVDAHLCCGSAGTYALLQSEISGALRDRKLAALLDGGRPGEPPPDFIVTANIGCLSHLQSGSAVPVRHWIELISEQLETGTS